MLTFYNQVHQLTQKVEEVTGETVEVAFVDEGYTGEGEDIHLEVTKLPDVKKGFVLLSRRWLARGYERLPETLIALHFSAQAIRMAQWIVETMHIVHSS